jgi:hypothetical protein
MAKIFIHCGQPKTGTTSLQRTLSNNAALLQKHGYLYPETAPMAHRHTALTAAVSVCAGRAMPKRIMAAADFDATEAMNLTRAALARYYEQVASTQPDVILISCEGLTPSKNSNIIDAYQETFVSRGEELNGVIYLRNPADAYLSNFQERLKQRSTLTQPINPKLNQIAQKFFALYGRDNGHLRAYDRTQMPQGDVFNDYVEVIGARDVPFERLEREYNTSFSAEAMVILSEVMPSNDVSNARERDRFNRIKHVLKKSDRAVGDITRPELHDKVRAHFELVCDDLHKLRDENGLVLPNIDYTRVGSSPAAEMKVENVFDVVQVDNSRLAEVRAKFANRIKKFTGE